MLTPKLYKWNSILNWMEKVIDSCYDDCLTLGPDIRILHKNSNWNNTCFFSSGIYRFFSCVIFIGFPGWTWWELKHVYSFHTPSQSVLQYNKLHNENKIKYMHWTIYTPQVISGYSILFVLHFEECTLCEVI